MEIRLHPIGEQPLLVQPSPEEIQKLKSRVCGLLSEYIKLEKEKNEANKDFNDRLIEMWDEISGLQLRINEAERG